MFTACKWMMIGFCMTVLAGLSQASIYYVDDDAPLGGDGQSWQSAFRYLRDALSAVQAGDEVRIAQGTYRPSESETSVSGGSFILTGDTVIRGGYAGLTETNPDDRDIELYETILSGDLDGDDYYLYDFADFAACYTGKDNRRLYECRYFDYDSDMDIDEADRALFVQRNHFDDNSSSLLYFNISDTGQLHFGIEGVIIEKAVSGRGYIYMDDLSVTFRQVTFRNNLAYGDGGGIRLHTTEEVVFDTCHFIGNVCFGGGGGLQVGYQLGNFEQNTNVFIRGCRFEENWARTGGGACIEFLGADIDDCRFIQNHNFYNNNYGTGGALCLLPFYQEITVRDCLFQENESDGFGGAIYSSGQDGRYPGTLLVNDCLFERNSAEDGGALYGGADVTDCLFKDNTAQGKGGAVSAAPNFLGYNPILNISHSVMAGNSAHDGGAFAGMGTVDRCIFRSNRAENLGGAFVNLLESTVTNCLFQDNVAGGSGFAIGNSLLDNAPIIEPTYRLKLYNCTVMSNQFSGLEVPEEYAGAAAFYNVQGQQADLVNNIFWCNSKDGYRTEAEQIVSETGAVLDIRSCCIEGWTRQLGGVGNFGSNPLLVDYYGPDSLAGTADDDLRPSASSPCLDTGDSSIWNGDELDLVGRPRLTGSAIDIGAVEADISLPTTVHPLYVDAQAGGNNDGSSWGHAFVDLQSALSYAVNHPCRVEEIWVAQGTYRPTGPDGDRAVSFVMKKNLEIYGGFPSRGGTWAQREPYVYKTILSGDLNGDDHFGGDNSENSNHVVDASDTNYTAILDGFVIQGGNGSRGGGLYADYGSPLIANCCFYDNYADGGGGAGFVNSVGLKTGDPISDMIAPMLVNCLFHNNSAQIGGALYAEFARPAIINCAIVDNRARMAGGMSLGRGFDATVQNSVFWGNQADTGPQIRLHYSADQPNSLYVGQCDIEGGYDGIDQRMPADIVWDSSNIDLDPMFIDPDGPDNVPGTLDDDYRLRAGSPCINRGNNFALPTWVTHDLAGGPRVLESVVDMGAYETEYFGLSSAVSRRTHGNAGAFDVDILNKESEPRVDGPQELVLTFSEAITAADGTLDQEVSLSAGQVDGLQIDGSTLTVWCSHVPDDTCLTIEIDGLQSVTPVAQSWNGTLSLAVVCGDIDGDHGVNVLDLITAKRHSGQFARQENFRNDMLCLGYVNVAHIIMAKKHSGGGVQCP